MSQVSEIIMGETISWTNYGVLMKLFMSTKCPKCKQKYEDELWAFHKYNKKVYNVWHKNTKKNQITNTTESDSQ